MFCKKFFHFQVHEKSILLAAIPAAAASAIAGDGHFKVTLWFLTAGTLSMTPLLVKDGLLWSALALSLVFVVVCRRVGDASQWEESPRPRGRVKPIKKPNDNVLTQNLYNLFTILSALGKNSSLRAL